MKFVKRIEMCRHDDKVPIGVFMNINYKAGGDCMHLVVNKKCIIDKKPCKIEVYERRINGRND